MLIVIILKVDSIILNVVTAKDCTDEQCFHISVNSARPWETPAGCQHHIRQYAEKNISVEGTRKILRREGYKVKEIHHVPVGRNTEAAKESRFQDAVNMSTRLQQDADRFMNSVVYLDEAGFNLHTGRRNGWARVGQRAVVEI